MRKVAPICCAYFVSLLVVVAAFSIPEIVRGMLDPEAHFYTGLNEMDIVLMVFIGAFSTTALPFSIVRFYAGKTGNLNYIMAAVAGAILGLIGCLMFDLMGAGLREFPWLVASVAALGLVTAVIYWWLEQQFTKRFAPAATQLEFNQCETS